MSVLVRGMEMPKSCNYCTFSSWSNLYQTMRCNRCTKLCFKEGSEEYMVKRPDWCPIVEVPAPHGRLIDADGLDVGEYEREDDDSGTLEISLGGLLSLYHKVIDAPTVIEAEGTE